MTTIASLIVEIGADITGLTRGVNQAEKKVDNFIGGMGSKLTGIGSSLTGIGTKLTAATLPLAGIFAKGLSVASDFDSVMAEIGARAGLTAEGLAEVSEFALQMGADTSFSGQQAADAMLQLLTSGQTAEQAMATLPAILDAAAASGEDLGTTADNITDIMASFGLEVDDAASVVDSLARAAGASSADMGSLADGFANVGGVARAFGLSVNRTSAILAVLSENGVKGAEAGTALKSLLLNMTRPTEEVAGAWERLGTSFYDSEGNARDLTDVLEDIKVGMEDMTVEQQNEEMVKLGGSYGVVALQALLGATSIEEMEASMEGSAGAADVAAARMDTFAGRMDSLMGSVETLMITALTPLMNDVLKPMAEQVTEVVNSVTDWAKANPELTSKIVALAGGLLIVGPALVVAGIGIQAMGVAIGALGVVVGIIASPLFLAAAGLLAIGAGLAYIWTQDIGGVKTKIEEIGNSIRDADFSGAADEFKNKLTGIFDTAGASVDTAAIETWATDNTTEILNTVIAVAGIVLGGPIGLTIGAAKLISTAIENDFLGLKTFLDSSGISSAVTTAFEDLKADIGSIIDTVFSSGSGADPNAALAEMFASGQAVQAPGGTMSAGLQQFVADLRLGLSWLSDQLPLIVGPITDALATFGPNIREFIDNLSGAETGGLLRIATAVGGAIGLIVTKLLEVGANLVGDVLTNISNALPQIGSFISDFVTTLSRIGEGDWGGAAQKLADSVGHLVSAGLNLIGLDIDFASWGESLAGWVTAFESAWAGIQFVADGIRRTITGFFLDIQIKFGEWVGDLRQRILDLTQLLPGGAVDIAPNIDVQLNMLREQRGGFDIADQIHADLAADLTAGSIDLSPELAGAIAWNPEAIAAGMSAAGKDAVQQALVLALTQGDEAGYNVLLPLATELGIDQASIAGQLQVAVNAAAALEYSATMNVDVALNPIFSGMQGPAMVPAFANGGLMQSDGMAYLHAGERVLNPQQTQAYDNGNGGGNTNTVNLYGVQDIDGMLSELARRGIYFQ